MAGCYEISDRAALQLFSFQGGQSKFTDCLRLTGLPQKTTRPSTSQKNKQAK